MRKSDYTLLPELSGFMHLTVAGISKVYSGRSFKRFGG